MNNIKLKEIIDFLESHAPLHYQEAYDNSGLIIGDMESEISGALICLDVTDAVLQEAVDAGYNLIISHHPMIFGGIKSLISANYTQRLVRSAILMQMNIYSIHTNLDNLVNEGVNARIGQQLLLIHARPLRVGIHSKEEPAKGIGLIGELPRAMQSAEFLSFLKDRMQTDCVRYTLPVREPIQQPRAEDPEVFLFLTRIAAGADVFISGDFKYHDFFDAQIMIADIGHYESEQFTIDLLYDLISVKFSNFAVRKTSMDTNPIKYF